MLRPFLSETIPQWKMPGKEKLEIIESQFLSQYIGEYQDKLGYSIVIMISSQ